MVAEIWYYSNKESNKRNKDKVDNASREGYTTGVNVGRTDNLNAYEQEAGKMPGMLADKYAADWAADGLTGEAHIGGNSLDSLLQAGLRGGRFAINSRQQALRKELGMEQEPFDSTTQSNVAGLPGSASNPTQGTLPPSTAPAPSAYSATDERQEESPVSTDQTAAPVAPKKKKV